MLNTLTASESTAVTPETAQMDLDGDGELTISDVSKMLDMLAVYSAEEHTYIDGVCACCGDLLTFAVLFNNGEINIMLSSTANGSKLEGAYAVYDSETGTYAAEAGYALLTKKPTSNGTLFLVNEENLYLTSGETGSSLYFTETVSAYSEWVLEESNGYTLIKNANAAYNGKAQYLEYYNGFTTYSYNASNASIYQFTLVAAADITLHEHAWVAGEVTAPTCTEDGYTTYSCSACGKVKTDDVTEKTGHTLVDGVCTVCGVSTVETYVILSNGMLMGLTASGTKLTAISATYNETLKQYVPASADYAVITQMLLDNGNVVLKNQNGEYLTSTGKNNLTFSAEKTENSEWNIEEVGEYTFLKNTSVENLYLEVYEGLFTCYTSSTATSKSAYQLTLLSVDDIHSHLWETTDTVYATCTEHGYEAQTCNACGATRKIDGDPAHGHYFGTDGVCYNCGATEEETPATGSVGFVTSSDGLKIGDVLTFVCKDKLMEANGFNNGSVDRTSSDYIKHVAYTDTPAGVFTFEVVAGANDNTFAFKVNGGYIGLNASGNYLQVRSKLDANSSWTVSFDADGNAIIENAQYTTRSIRYNSGSPRFATYTSAQTAIQLYRLPSSTCEHVWDEGVVTEGTCTTRSKTTYTCTLCSKTKVTEGYVGYHNVEEVVVTEATDCAHPGLVHYICTVCNSLRSTYKPTIDHSYESEVTTEATCSAAGLKTYTCTVCGDSYTEEFYLDHSYDEGEVTTAPTCTESGEKIYTCTECGATRTETVSALGHTIEGNSCTTCGMTGTLYAQVAPNKIQNGDKILIVGFAYDRRTGGYSYALLDASTGTVSALPISLLANGTLFGDFGNYELTTMTDGNGFVFGYNYNALGFNTPDGTEITIPAVLSAANSVHTINSGYGGGYYLAASSDAGTYELLYQNGEFSYASWGSDMLFFKVSSGEESEDVDLTGRGYLSSDNDILLDFDWMQITVQSESCYGLSITNFELNGSDLTVTFEAAYTGKLTTATFTYDASSDSITATLADGSTIVLNRDF